MNWAQNWYKFFHTEYFKLLKLHENSQNALYYTHSYSCSRCVTLWSARVEIYDGSRKVTFPATHFHGLSLSFLSVLPIRGRSDPQDWSFGTASVISSLHVGLKWMNGILKLKRSNVLNGHKKCYVLYTWTDFVSGAILSGLQCIYKLDKL